MSSGSPSVESLPSSHLPVKLPPGSTSFSHADHHFFILRMWRLLSPNPWWQFLWEEHCVWTMNGLQDTIKVLERTHFFVHILQKSREPVSEALHSNCIHITPPGSSVNDRETQRSRNCLQMASKITFIFMWHSLVKSKPQQLIVYLICSFLGAYLVDYMEVAAWIINKFAAITGEKNQSCLLVVSDLTEITYLPV